MDLTIPEGATHCIAGTYYKYGLHGWIYRHNSAKDEWQKSERKDLKWMHSLKNPLRTSDILESEYGMRNMLDSERYR